MPTKHIIKQYDAPAFYHVYNRASGERQLFRDRADRLYFLHLLQKHLAENENDDPADDTRTYPVEIVAYCLMGSHFHLLLYQEDVEAISGYMRSVATSYSMYYNKKYKSKGHVFQSSFRASHINQEEYLAHITRYIHLNPRNHRSWQWSSYKAYAGEERIHWVHPERVGVESRTEQLRYAVFVDDYTKTDRRVQYATLHGLLAE